MISAAPAAVSRARASSACWPRSAKRRGRRARDRGVAAGAQRPDWHTLIEFCGLVGTIIVDEDGIYDPRHPNDRLLLGMKGTMSELELSLFRQRSQEALKQKARRGALILGVAAGYVKVGRDRIEKNPDQRRRRERGGESAGCIATRLLEVCRVPKRTSGPFWLRDKAIELPVKSRKGEAHGIIWRLPAYNIVHNILTNPIYAGAYAFGRTTSRVSVETAASACGAACIGRWPNGMF